MASKFIKIPTMIINTSHINKILIYDTKYYLYLMNKNSFGFAIFGWGFFESKDEEHIICAKKNPISYKVITDWIDNEFK